MDDATRQRLRDGEECMKAALLYLQMGMAPLALCPPDHVGVARVDPTHLKGATACSSPGKRPWHPWKVFQDRLPTEAEVRSWWDRLPNSNLGIALGDGSSHKLRLDSDGAAGMAALAELSRGDMPPTWQFTSGRTDGPAQGWIYQTPTGTPLATTIRPLGLGQELRLQAKGAQTVVPPSRHQSGRKYEWLPGHSPQDLACAPAPEWLIKALLPHGRQNGDSAPGRSPDEWAGLFAGSEQGRRDDDMTALIGGWLSDLRDLDSGRALQRVWESALAVNERSTPPMEEAQVKKIFVSILRAEKKSRAQKDTAFMDSFVCEQIDRAAPAPPLATPPESSAESNLPEWHLVIVHSDPPEYRLRSPFWSSSPALLDGYLLLSIDQVMNWGPKGNSIKRAAFTQAQTIVPGFLKEWATPGGFLERLTRVAKHVEVSEESQRSLYILAWVLRYLERARPAEDHGEDLRRTSRPVLAEDGAILFHFHHLKDSWRQKSEDFGHREVARLLEQNDIVPQKTARGRFWVASVNALIHIRVLIGEPPR